MALKRLTARLVETASCDSSSKRTELRDTLERGLKLRITHNNRKSWALQYTRDRANRTITLGPYPEHSLDDARRWARAIKADIARDKDPAQIKQDKKQAQNSAQTFEELAIVWVERYAKPTKRERSVKDDISMLQRHILPVLGHIKAHDITKRDIIRLLDTMIAKSDARAAMTGEYRQMSHRPNRVYALLRTIFKWALERDILKTDPMLGIKKPIKKEPPRDHVLSETEIIKLWKSLEGANGARGRDTGSTLRMSRNVAAAIQLSLVTAQRIGEVLSVRRDEINLNDTAAIWIIPGERSKNGRPNRVPLSPLAVRLIAETIIMSDHSEWLFPNPTNDGSIDPHAATKAVGRSRDKIGIEDFRVHDLRRTAATYMAECGVSEYTIGLVLNHQSTRRGTVTGKVYNQYSYDKEKREALNKWDKRLWSILRRQTASNLTDSKFFDDQAAV